MRRFELSTSFFILLGWVVLTNSLKYVYVIRASLENEEIVSEDGPLPLATSISAPSSSGALPFMKLVSSEIVVMTCVSCFLSLGVGGAFSASIGNLAKTLSPEFATVDDVQELTFRLTFAFLLSQLAGRMSSTVVYSFGEVPWLFPFWVILLVVGVGLFSFTVTAERAVVSAVLTGLSFGGVWSTFPALASNFYPGNSSVDFATGISVTMFSASVGPFVVGKLQVAVYNAGSLLEVHTSVKYVFLFFFGLSFLALSTSTRLGYLVRKEAKSRTRVASEDDVDVVDRGDVELADVDE